MNTWWGKVSLQYSPTSKHKWSDTVYVTNSYTTPTYERHYWNYFFCITPISFGGFNWWIYTNNNTHNLHMFDAVISSHILPSLPQFSSSTARQRRSRPPADPGRSSWCVKPATAECGLDSVSWGTTATSAVPRMSCHTWIACVPDGDSARSGYRMGHWIRQILVPKISRLTWRSSMTALGVSVRAQINL